MGDEVLIAVKSGGAPSLRPRPKRPGRLNRRRISRYQLYTSKHKAISLYWIMLQFIATRTVVEQYMQCRMLE